jgi:hypothetical protein
VHLRWQWICIYFVVIIKTRTKKEKTRRKEKTAYSVFLAIWVFLLALANDFLCEKPVQKALAKANKNTQIAKNTEYAAKRKEKKKKKKKD